MSILCYPTEDRLVIQARQTVLNRAGRVQRGDRAATREYVAAASFLIYHAIRRIVPDYARWEYWEGPGLDLVGAYAGVDWDDVRNSIVDAVSDLIDRD